MLIQSRQKITFSYILVTLAAVLFTWLLHEFCHWLVGESLGNPMAMTLNASFPASGSYVSKAHESMVSIAGPAVTTIEAILVYLLLRKKASPYLFSFLFTCFYMRLVASVLNFINLNDEGRVSHDLGIGTATIPILISLFLFYLVYDIIKKRSFSKKWVIATLLLVMLFSSVLVLSDQAFHIRLL